ncbi:hypothetical protein HanXRQr2_Chr12g0534301 [Helianthus annuus]|uniref:Uncharacterized protein n=1 Tax=Helianthus annuus TaxID=4232 RepID=A0A9K3HFE9_HELAN|nr:hypothetical protein HanXRQr2_Chr12g0534301 [Helianthus annuus]KAJ0862133.1 hypothetical protein HanPSC8_Chr12g0514591 [Helianthus annuus]
MEIKRQTVNLKVINNKWLPEIKCADLKLLSAATYKRLSYIFHFFSTSLSSSLLN